MSTRAVAAAVALALWPLLTPSSAGAFSDPAFYALPAPAGGGAGRQFTGSPVDGHSCSVCHSGGTVPAVSLVGLPERFEPGRRYEVRLTFTPVEISHALQLELMDAEGRHPALEIVPPEALPPAQRCDGAPAGAPAVYTRDVGLRRVIGVQDCGASELWFAFTGPSDANELTFAAGIVRSDSSATAGGDGVLEIRRRLLRQGQTPSAGCALAPAAASPLALNGGVLGGGLAGVALVVARLVTRKRSQRRRSPQPLTRGRVPRTRGSENE